MGMSELSIDEFFKEFIFGFVYTDIERCIQAGANYVVALALLSYTEYIGGLISGNLCSRDRGIANVNFNTALEYFPKGYQDINSSLVVEYIDEKGKFQRDCGIYSLFRCGMIHEYFIKGLGTVINDPKGRVHSDQIGISVLPVEMPTGLTEKYLLFHTNEYFRDFRSAVDKIFKLLTVEKDQALLKLFAQSIHRADSRRVI